MRRSLDLRDGLVVASFVVLGFSVLATNACGGANADLGLAPDGGGGGADGNMPGTDAAGGSDGSAPGNDAIAPAPDATMVLDTGAPLTFCATAGTHLFCDDFDSSTTLKARWDTQLVLGVADAQLATASFKSPPASFVASTSQAVTQGAVALLQKSFASQKAFDVQFDVFVDAYGGDPTAGSMDYTAIAGLASGPFSVGLFAVSPTQAGIVESSSADGGNGSTNYHPLSGGIPAGQWVHVDILVNYPLQGNTGKARVKVNGTTVLQTDLTSPSIPADQSVFSLGVYVGHAASPWMVHFDNVLVDKG
jgi:hypothetical protein